MNNYATPYATAMLAADAVHARGNRFDQVIPAADVRRMQESMLPAAQKHEAHRAAPYCVTRREGLFYVLDPRTGNVSRPFNCHESALVALHGLSVRNLINE